MAEVTTGESQAASTHPADSHPTDSPPTDSFRPKAPRSRRKTLVRAIVLLLVLAVVAVGSFYAWKYFSA